MKFLETILSNLEQTPDKTIFQEVWGERLEPVKSFQILEWVGQARASLRQAGLKPGDRCALLGFNSSRWVAINLAIMVEGAIAVPLYSRQAPRELIAMLKDCTASLLCCQDESLSEVIRSRWTNSPTILHFPQILKETSEQVGPQTVTPEVNSTIDNQQREAETVRGRKNTVAKASVVTIIYTSGTSGEPKGVMLNDRNIDFMLQQTTTRLEELMQDSPKMEDDRVFHYLPFCFAGSWTLLLTCLYRNNCLMISTDLNNLANELKVARPHYVLNVPALLERIRASVSTKLRNKGGIGWFLFNRGQSAWLRRYHNEQRVLDFFWLALSDQLVFSKIRMRLGPNLRALICGSAPLADETQLFFQMLGIPVLQVYGLTETTAICTMDDVNQITVGRVGPAIRDTDMIIDKNGEILVRGPHIFPGYWNQPQATTAMIQDGWLRTGDQGEVDHRGNWKIIGRIKNVLITSGGHNISPEPIERMLLEVLSGGVQVIIVGNGRKYLVAILAGPLDQESATRALNQINQKLPHYQQIRRFHLTTELFSIENGLLSANGKQRRAGIEAHYRSEINALYQNQHSK